MSCAKIILMGIKVVSTNRKASFEYFLLEHFEAGLSLMGTEIKSIREGQISLAEAYVQVSEREAWLVNAHIAPYDPASQFNHDPKRPRRLLLHRREIRGLWDEVRQKGVTVVPLKVYLKDGRAKIEIALAKGKKLYDKRDEIEKRDTRREVERQLRGKDR
jgi:SsrA-binding protein